MDEYNMFLYPYRVWVALIVIGSLGLLSQPAVAQELSCRITVNTRALGTTGFEQLEGDFKAQVDAYINERSWTNDTYLEDERISCSFLITFREGSSGNRYVVQMNVGLQRPIYGTLQTTNVLQLVESNWTFDFEPNQPLIFDPERFDQITSIFDFYAYLLLGYDYDTFSELGGTEYFNRARRIAELGQSSGGLGWNLVDNGQTKGALITQLLNPRLERIRKAYFEYHYDCLDHFISSAQRAQQACMSALTAMQEVYEEVSNQYVVDLFFSTKNQELVSVFEESAFSSQAYGILLNVDPSRSSIYDRLVQ
jgi:hypothetical protein